MSAASLWEIAIKRSIGKLDFHLAPSALVQAIREEIRAQILPIEAAHLEQVEQLPWHHRDPFDRLLVGQALADGLHLLTVDPDLEPYGIPVMRR